MKRSEITARIKDIAHNLETQDNRITENPIFAVMQKRRIYGMSKQYCDDSEMLYNDSKGKSEKAYYVDTDEFVTACLTEQGCKDYLEINGHNLNRPFIYVFGGWRNAEWKFLRETMPVILETLEGRNDE